MLTASERAWLRLHLTKGLGRRGLFELQRIFSTPEEILDAGPARWPERVGSLRSANAEIPAVDGATFLAAVDRLEAVEAHLVSCWDASYPEPLKSIHDPPALLYVRGQFDIGPALAIVGSRRCSPQGRKTTREFAREVARHGIAIISGLARGIDSAAHEGALDSGGQTMAVLGCGIDRVYPPENSRLFHRICEQGAVISEYPPGTEPLAGHFPGRNRIISGLSRGVLVVEAADGSGSLITAEFALEQGREVFAVPGAISAPNSSGVNSLLKDGAHLVTAPEDILHLISPGGRPTPTGAGPSPLEGLSETELRLAGLLSAEPLQADDLARKSGLTPMELSAILLQLELRGIVTQLPGMRYLSNF